MRTVLILFLLYSCSFQSPRSDNTLASHFPSGEKINGAGLVAPYSMIDESALDSLSSIHTNYVCLMPFAFVKPDEAAIYYNGNHQAWGESPNGIACCIKMAHDRGMKVMVKPQLWAHHGEYTGDIKFSDVSAWEKFEDGYSDYILQLAKVADSSHADIFCIGTELNCFVASQNQYWSGLIDSVRKIYHGQVTYAENWDCYQRIPFWNKLDYIGVNAYFPLSDHSTPEVEDLKQKWQPWLLAMKSLSGKNQKPVLFTEYGYRSIDGCAKAPWEFFTSGKTNYTAQQNAYEAMFETFWNQDWFAGGFFWKWYDKLDDEEYPIDQDFTPQQKPVLQVIRKWYEKKS
ncbi:MAG: hypothetical protein H0W62_01175 [Chitinophagales bacterium]|nr:hypothetical protein [Chitinophagales bacterium]